MKKYFYLIAFLFFALYNPLFGQTDTVFILPNTTIVGDQVRVDFPVQKFNGVVCLQYTMIYDESVLQFDNMGNLNLPDLSETNFNASNPGFINFSWVDLTTMGITRADDESIYSIFFSVVGNGGVSNLYIDGSQTPVEACISTGVIPLIFQTISISAFATSNDDIEDQIKIDVYPNPSTDLVTFELEGVQTASQLEIYDATGKLMDSCKFRDNILVLSKEDLGAGLYFYRLYSNDKVINTGKFTFL